MTEDGGVEPVEGDVALVDGGWLAWRLGDDDFNPGFATRREAARWLMPPWPTQAPLPDAA